MTDEAAQEPVQEPVRDERFYRSSEWQFYMLWLRGQGREAEARQVCEEALAFNPTPQAQFALGISLLREGLHQEAAQAFQQAIDQRPDFAIAYDGLGRALTEMGHYDEAISVLTRLIEISPKYSAAFHFIGDVYRKKGDLASAVRVYQDGVRAGAYSELLVDLGDALREAGRVEEARDVLESAAAEYPNFPEAHLALGKALREVGRTDEARGAWERVLVLTHDTEEGSYFEDRDRSLEAQAQALLSETEHEKQRA